MARFDVYRLRDGGLVLDCQADLLADIGTRFVLPLMPPREAPPTSARLNPRFDVDGEQLVLVPQLATAIRTVEMKAKVGTLAREDYAIISAIDVLIGSG